MHRLVVVGDSLSQGFMSGAISRCDIAWPTWVADALGNRDDFLVPEFNHFGGLPLNIEAILRRLSDLYGQSINWWELAPAVVRVRELLDDTEDYWERGRGSLAQSRRTSYRNLSVWGFEVRDAYTVSEGDCRSAISPPNDDLLQQVPEKAMYRTARRVLNSDFGNLAMGWSQLDSIEQLAKTDGIENLVVMLGANNALGTVTSLNIHHSEEQDLFRLPHERKCNLYLPLHFERLFHELAERIERIDNVGRVFLGTVPHVTIPPATRGVSPKGTFEDGYFEFYTRPWIWDNDFDKDRHPHLTRSQASQIDTFIDQYNTTIQAVVDRHANWHIVDVCQLLDDVAFRRNLGSPTFKWPNGLVKALKKHLNYLVEGRNKVLLDSRFLKGSPENPGQLEKGGFFSLDGIHPTTIGYGVMADVIMKSMKDAGVHFDSKLDWDGIVRADTLVGNPPALLTNLKETLSFIDSRGLLSSVFEQFG